MPLDSAGSHCKDKDLFLALFKSLMLDELLIFNNGNHTLFI